MPPCHARSKPLGQGLNPLRGQLGVAPVGEACLSGRLDGTVQGSRAGGVLGSAQEVAPGAQVCDCGAHRSSPDAGSSWSGCWRSRVVLHIAVLLE
eukprot:6820906-Alexandrium_andersonii.AAC.1